LGVKERKSFIIFMNHGPKRYKAGLAPHIYLNYTGDDQFEGSYIGGWRRPQMQAAYSDEIKSHASRGKSALHGACHACVGRKRC
jgi:hypothetical protein